MGRWMWCLTRIDSVETLRVMGVTEVKSWGGKPQCVKSPGVGSTGQRSETFQWLLTLRIPSSRGSFGDLTLSQKWQNGVSLLNSRGLILSRVLSFSHYPLWRICPLTFSITSLPGKTPPLLLLQPLLLSSMTKSRQIWHDLYLDRQVRGDLEWHGLENDNLSDLLTSMTLRGYV